MNSVTIVIPIFNVNKYRKRNLDYTIPKLIKTGNNIVIIEHSRSGKPSYSHGNVNHVTIKHDSNVICKSLLINIASNHVKTSHMWVVDADFCMNFKNITEECLNYDYVQPFYYSKDLTEQETELLIAQNHIKTIFYENDETRHINIYGALSFIISKHAFARIGMMDETYTGWGYEDIDMFMRIHEKALSPVHILKSNTGVHMWHPTSAVKPVSRIINKRIFNSKGYTMQKVNKILKEHYYPDWSFKNID